MTDFSAEIKSWLLILTSFFVALVLMFLRLPSWSIWICPQWLGIVVLYWAWIMPQRVNVGVAWLVGVLLDFLYHTPVGENALALVLATYLIIKFREKFRLLYFWKKVLVLFSLIAWCQFLPFLMQVYLGEGTDFWPILTQGIVGTFVWLVIAVLFNRRRKLYFESYY